MVSTHLESSRVQQVARDQVTEEADAKDWHLIVLQEFRVGLGHEIPPYQGECEPTKENELEQLRDGHLCVARMVDVALEGAARILVMQRTSIILVRFPVAVMGTRGASTSNGGRGQGQSIMTPACVVVLQRETAASFSPSAHAVLNLNVALRCGGSELICRQALRDARTEQQREREKAAVHACKAKLF